jgi:hypothetical protein
MRIDLAVLVPGALLLALTGCSPGSTSTAGTTTDATTVPPVTSTTGSSGSGGAVSGVGQQGGDGAVAPGTQDSVVATPSVGGTLQAAVGTSRTVSIAFNSSDAQLITGFAISNTALPAGWSGPAAFGCDAVSTGSGCVLNLTYTPGAAVSGTLTLDYVYIDNAMVPVAPGGTVTIPFSGIAQNSIAASVEPLGQITAPAGGGRQSVIVSFATDNGIAATGFSIAAAPLPAGWSGGEAGLSCNVVSTGNGCQLVLQFAPTAPGSGTLTVPYAYQDDSGAARSGAVNIPYMATASGSVVAVASPAGEVDATVGGGSRAVQVSFSTNDGSTATDLQVSTDLAKLPAGWTGPAGKVTCASVSGGAGCRLQLAYAPTAAAVGTLTLNYLYLDGSGAEQGGALNIPYAGTANDTVTGSVSPAGPVTAVAGDAGQGVTITFTTDDGLPATGFQVTSDLTALPAGWTSAASSLACSAISAVNTCQLSLQFDPLAAESGTLSLNYSYLNDALVAKTGSVDIAYRGTTNDVVTGRPDPAPLVVAAGTSRTVRVTFTTDDGAPASALAFTSAPTSLPAGWTVVSGAAGCASVSGAVPCELVLAYTPVSAGSGSLAIDYRYVNDAGLPGTGTATVAYAAVVAPP